MTSDSVTILQMPEFDVVEEWRLKQLVEAGYAPDNAIKLAADHTVDLHLACDLLLKGCDQSTATEILA